MTHIISKINIYLRIKFIQTPWLKSGYFFVFVNWCPVNKWDALIRSTTRVYTFDIAVFDTKLRWIFIKINIDFQQFWQFQTNFSWIDQRINFSFFGFIKLLLVFCGCQEFKTFWSEGFSKVIWVNWGQNGSIRFYCKHSFFVIKIESIRDSFFGRGLTTFF